VSTTQQREPWIRVPRVHTGTGPPHEPIPCGEVCITCRQYRHVCAHGPGTCAPVCARRYVRPGPVHVCLITTHVAARLVVRPNRARTTVGALVVTAPSSTGAVMPHPEIGSNSTIVSERCVW
jgi:hypothetical protein